MSRQAKRTGEPSGSADPRVAERKTAINHYCRAQSEADTMSEDVSEARKTAKEILKRAGLRADAIESARKLKKKLDAHEIDRWFEDFELACEFLDLRAQGDLFEEQPGTGKPTGAALN